MSGFQEMMRQLRENPDPQLIDFVAGLEPGRGYWTKELSIMLYGQDTDGAVLRYALSHAGMVKRGRQMYVAT